MIHGQMPDGGREPAYQMRRMILGQIPVGVRNLHRLPLEVFPTQDLKKKRNQRDNLENQLKQVLKIAPGEMEQEMSFECSKIIIHHNDELVGLEEIVGDFAVTMQSHHIKWKGTRDLLTVH